LAASQAGNERPRSLGRRASDFDASLSRGGRPRYAGRQKAHWLEWQDWANPVLQRSYEVKDGRLHIPDVPGLGVEWDEKVVAAHPADSF